MSDMRAILALGTIIALASMLVVSQVMIANNSANVVTYGMLGHITTIVQDADGNIKAYQQNDNIIVNEGVDCATDLAFPTNFGDCSAVINQISINSQTSTVDDADTSITGELQKETGVITSSKSATVSVVGDAKFTLSKSFTIANTATVGSTGLLSGIASTLFAGQALTSPIPVLPGDLVTINWDIIVT